MNGLFLVFPYKKDALKRIFAVYLHQNCKLNSFNNETNSAKSDFCELSFPRCLSGPAPL